MDFNDQSADWLSRANAVSSRTGHGRLGRALRPDRAAMQPLTPAAPEFVFRSSVRLTRDYYLRVFSADYSLDPGRDRAEG